MKFNKINGQKRLEGLDPRVCAMLEERPEEWSEDKVSGFVRVWQGIRDKPGYETLEAFKARDRDIISWSWLEDISLIPSGGRIVPESEKRHGLSLLREFLDDLARRRGEL